MARLTTRGRRTAVAVASAAALSTGIAGIIAMDHTQGDEPHAAAGRGEAKEQPAARSGPSGTHAGTKAISEVPTSIAHQAEKGGRSVNITIDDGPDPDWTPQVLSVLARYGVKATFCMLGPAAQAHPDLVRQVVAEGHRLCDHSVSHDTTMDHRSAAFRRKEIVEGKRMIESAADGQRVRYYRAPGGAFTPDSRKVAAAHGMRPLGWNVDTKDFKRPGADTIVRTIKNELPNGPTLLFHDGGGPRDQTVEALDEALPWLIAQGYDFSFPKTA